LYALLAVIGIALTLLAVCFPVPASGATRAGPAVQDEPPYWLLQGPGVTSFGPFAGYVWNGSVRSVAASWTVPRITPGSHSGTAGTWIGAQAPGSRFAPFIQVGINEVRLSLPGRGGRNFYYAFYSDTKLGFHPQILFQVRVGDTLSARLRLGGGRWHILIVDHTHPHRSAFGTRDEAGGVFNQAEWLQEDVSKKIGQVLPYPVLATVGFRHLTVNYGAPSYAKIRSQWMSENGTDLAPSALVADAFRFAPTEPTAIGLHYLQITVPLDVALGSFEAEFARWPTSARKMASQRAAFAVALESDILEVEGTQWPVGVQPLSAKLVSATKLELAQTELASTYTAQASVRWLTDWFKDDATVVAISQKIRRVLNLPQAFPLPPG
jgi:hypothetical protein